MPGPNISWLRSVAAKRIAFFERELGEMGILARFGAELEFIPLNAHGIPEKHLLKETKLTEHLRQTIPGIERVHCEIGPGAQYELVTGLNPNVKGLGLEHASPLATAENVVAFQDAFAANAERWKMGGVSFKARQLAVGKIENSGLHMNISLWTPDGKTNLFAKHGGTTDLERHVIDSLIQTHAAGNLAYLPSANSFERINSIAQLKADQWHGFRDVMSGVPTVAGYMPSKGMTLGHMWQMGTDAAVSKRYPIASITSRYRSTQGMAMGAIERVTTRGVRSNMIGWETPAQCRLESRLAAADADPYVVVASELAAIHEAVKAHARPFDPKTFSSERHILIESGGRKLAVDRHTSGHERLYFPEDIDAARLSLAADRRSHALLGDDLYHGIIAHGIDASHAGGQYAASVEHVARESAKPFEPHVTEITERINQAMASLDTPLRSRARSGESWVDFVGRSGNYPHQGGFPGGLF
jgi:hypothetical protein